MRSFDRVEAFDPIREATIPLKPYIGDKLIHHCALSEKNSNLSLYIPKDNQTQRFGEASLEKDSEYEERTVPVKTLDEFNFKNVDLIKIDTEGHEMNVLSGARRTLEAYSPILIIEIEQRHLGQHSIYDSFQTLRDFGYKGKFINNGNLECISSFDVENHQTKFLNDVHSNYYINNFIFEK